MTRSLNDWDRVISRTPVRSTFNFGFWVLIIILGLCAVGGVGFWGLNLLAQPGRVITQTFDANNMIHNYEWFRDKYAAIGGMDSQIVNVQGELDGLIATSGDRSTWSRATETQFNQVNSQLTGLKNMRIRMIQEYNGNASKANRSIFLAGLPDHIPLQ